MIAASTGDGSRSDEGIAPYAGEGGSFRRMSRGRSAARGPHPALRATFPMRGEGKGRAGAGGRGKRIATPGCGLVRNDRPGGGGRFVNRPYGGGRSGGAGRRAGAIAPYASTVSSRSGDRRTWCGNPLLSFGKLPPSPGLRETPGDTSLGEGGKNSLRHPACVRRRATHPRPSGREARAECGIRFAGTSSGASRHLPHAWGRQRTGRGGRKGKTDCHASVRTYLAKTCFGVCLHIEGAGDLWPPALSHYSQ